MISQADLLAGTFSAFMRQVAIGSEKGSCWDWQGKSGDGRYGHFCHDGGTTRAHRWIYEKVCGPIAEGDVIRHRCDNPKCVNPQHLVVGSLSQNTQDAIERGRWSDRSGELHPMAALKDADVTRIRQLAALGYTQHWIAEQYGISRQHVGKIVRRESWRHI